MGHVTRTMTSSSLNNTTRATSSVLQIDQRGSSQVASQSVNQDKELCRMDILRSLLFILALQLSVFYSHANVTSVKVSGN